MITIAITIKQVPAEAKHIHGMIEAKITNSNGTEEEISVSARILEKIRELGNELGEKPGGKVGIWEKYERRIKPGSDRGTDQDRETE